MAVQTSLRTVTRRIGDAIRSFVAGMGIDQSHVAIAASLDMENDRIYLVVGSDLPIESRRWHPGIRKAIRKAFEGTPDIDSRLVLVVRNVAAPRPDSW